MTNRDAIKRHATERRVPLVWQGAMQFAVVDVAGEVICERLPNNTEGTMLYATRKRAENGLRLAMDAGIIGAEIMCRIDWRPLGDSVQRGDRPA